MFEAVCAECGVPVYINEVNRWLNNGDIVAANTTNYRLIFFDCDYIDPVLKGIEETVGVPLEDVIMTSVRKAIRSYVELLLPDDINEMVRSGQLDPKAIYELIVEVAKFSGFGDNQFVKMRCKWDEDDFYTVKINKPYSLIMGVAGHVAALEAIFGNDLGVSYRKIDADSYEVTAFPTEHREELEKRLSPTVYEHREGDLELERCGTCGSPKGLSDYEWTMTSGLILNKINQRRMAIQGPAEIEPVFQELEYELGEEVHLMVVEAQRRFARSGFYSFDDIKDEDRLRKQFALYGIGNLRSLKVNRKGLSMRLDNAALHLIVTGMMQGIFEMAFNVDSKVDWELSDEGKLQVEVKPHG